MDLIVFSSNLVSLYIAGVRKGLVILPNFAETPPPLLIWVVWLHSPLPWIQVTHQNSITFVAVLNTIKNVIYMLIVVDFSEDWLLESLWQYMLIFLKIDYWKVHCNLLNEVNFLEETVMLEMNPFFSTTTALWCTDLQNLIRCLDHILLKWFLTRNFITQLLFPIFSLWYPQLLLVSVIRIGKINGFVLFNRFHPRRCKPWKNIGLFS